MNAGVLGSGALGIGKKIVHMWFISQLKGLDALIREL